MRICALLEKEAALGFRLAGVEAHIVKGREDMKNLFPAFLRLKDAGILLVSEALAEAVRDEINAHLYSGKLPIVVEVKPFAGQERQSKGIDELIKESIGISV